MLTKTPPPEVSSHDVSVDRRSWLLIAAAATVLLSMWAISSPIGSSPDDDFHLASIWCGGGISDLCQDGGGATREVPQEFIGIADCFRFKPWRAASCQGDGNQWNAAVLGTTEHVNSTNLYPPIYFRSMNLFAGEDTRRSALLARFANIAVALAGFSLAVATTQGRVRRAVLLSLLMGSLPLGIFLLASNNPSAWAFVGIASIWGPYFSLCVDDEGERRILAAAVVVVSAVLASARADSALFVPLVLGAVGIASGHWRRLSRPNSLVLGTGLAATAIAAGAVLSARQDHVITTGFTEKSVDSSGLSLLWFNVKHLHELFGGMVGIGWGLGWVDTRASPMAGALVLTAILAVLFSRRFGRSIDELVGAVVLAVTVVAMPLVVLQLGNNFVGQLLQPRYLLPLLPPMLGLFLIAQREPHQIAPRLHRFAAAGLALAHTVFLHTNLRRYVTGTDVVGWNLNEAIEWWWPVGPSPLLVWALGSSAFAVLAWAIVQMAADVPQADGHV